MSKFDPFTFDPTAFMSGQMESKLWLCDALYAALTIRQSPHRGPLSDEFGPGGATVWILAGWYGLTNVLLRAQNRVPIGRVISYDIDEHATAGALVLNESFHIRGRFDAITKDINEIEYGTDFAAATIYDPDIVINTSVEHIEGREWFDRIPEGTLVVLQSNDMEHLDEHTNTVKSVDDLMDQYDLKEHLYSGTKHFDYGEWSFNRFMFIGYK